MSRRVLADIDTEVLLRIANRTDITSTIRAHLIDDAYRWTALTFEHPQNEETTTGTITAATDVLTPVATDVWVPVLVKDTTNNKNLVMGDKYVIEEGSKMTGNPTKWFWWEGVLYIDRKPSADTACKIWYLKTLVEIASGESSIFDRAFDPIIIMKAAELGLSTVRDFKEAHVLSVEIDNYTSQWSLPKRKVRHSTERAGFRPRMR